MTIIIADRRMTGRKIQDQRERIKANIKDFYQYFKPNYERFTWWRNFVFKSSLSTADIALNDELDRPNIEFNIMESRMSRLLGEFAKQEPNLMVHQADLSVNQVDPELIRIIEGYIRAIFFESNRDNMEYEIYRDCLSGGFSAFKVYTDYMHEMAFDQNIMMKRCFDPTLVGFDKMAIASHKGDGMFCYELFPQSREEFEAEYGTEYTSKMSFTRDLDTFNWSYSTDTGETILIGDYYEKKKTSAKIVRLVDGQIMTESDYEKMQANWDNIYQAPGVVGKPRQTEIVTIARHRIVENGTLEYAETDYKYLPIIFVDGNSVLLREENNGAAQQMCRPMMYHMVGVQKLKNFAGIMLANHIENTPQSQFMLPEEGVPAEYKDAWINPQRANMLVYKAYMDNDVDRPLPPPMPVQRPVIPQEFMATFTGMDQVSQEILGSYDAALGINNNELSGQAIKAGATQSNTASMPFMVNYIRSLNRAAEIIVDLLPKYVQTPRSLPVRDSVGKRAYEMVNMPGTPQIQYDSRALGVKVEAGVNFELQRQQAFEMLSLLMDRVPTIGQFIGTTAEGIEMLLENIEVRGIDALKAAIPQFMQKVEQQEQQAQQMAKQEQQMMMQQTLQPMMLESQALKQRADNDSVKAQIQAAELPIKQQDADTRKLAVVAKLTESADRLQLESDKIQTEATRTAVDAITESINREHDQTMDVLNLHEKMNANARKSSD